MTTKYKIIAADGLAGFITDLAGDRKVFAPVEKDGVAKYDWVTESRAVSLDCPIPHGSAKQALFPRTEVLFYFKTAGNTEQVIPPKFPEPQAIFGLHPADIAAIRVLDAVFSAEPSPDGPYMDRREKTLLIGMGRKFEENPDTCFSHLMGISSMDAGIADIFITKLDDGRFIVEMLTAKADEISGVLDKLSDADKKDISELDELRRAAAEHVTNEFDPVALAKKLEGLFETGFWDKIGQVCVGCGACALTCPTCHCFDISEETRGQLGARVRNWDTCQFSLFTRHASGHNPRDKQSPRARQRIMHKFSYGYKNFEIPFCVGCGRCIENCPAHSDVREILTKINETR